MKPFSKSEGRGVEQLPETIDDLLEIADGSGEPATSACLTTLSPIAPGLRMVLLVKDDGKSEVVEDFGTGLAGEHGIRLAADIATQLSESNFAQFEVTLSSERLTVLALRMNTGSSGCIAGCVLDACEEPSQRWTDTEIAAFACSALSRAVTLSRAREAELSARQQQLVAEQEAFRVSYARNLAEAIEEHERRICEREESERELKRLHACNKLILDSAGEGIVGLDTEGRVTFVNPATEKMVGWTSDAMIGKSLHEILHHKKAHGQPYPWDECPVRKTLEVGATRRIEREVFWRKDGASFPVEYVATPIFEGPQIVGAVLTFQDVSERRVLEGQLLQAQKLESIGQLAAGIAHEINTPTQYVGDNTRFLGDVFGDLAEVMEGCRELLECSSERPIPESIIDKIVSALQQADLDYLIDEIPKAINQSLEGVERVAAIVRSMKDFSHPGGESKQAIDLNRALESTLTVCRNEWKYVADAVTDLDPTLPHVNCLPGECNQVFLNLIINAAHAIGERLSDGSTEKGTITVSTTHEGEWAEIRIRDTGTGIPENAQAKLFDPFFTTKEVGRGTGQGLAIAHSIVTEKHGGTISFETEIGVGTTFVVRLPIEG